MDGSISLNPVVALRNSFEELPAVVRRPIEMAVFGGELPRADISGMRRMAAEFQTKAAELDDLSVNANALLAQEDSVGRLGDQLRETLRVHRDGAARLGDNALALADQAQAAANEAEKTLCVMFVFGIELAWRIFSVLSGAAAAGPAGEVAALPVVESMLVEGRGRVAVLRAGLEQAFKAGATQTAARLSALGPLRLPVALGRAAALPVSVDAGVQALQVGSDDRSLAVIGSDGANPTGIDPTSIKVAALSGAGGALGGMVAGRIAPTVFPRIEDSRLALGLLHGTAGAVAGLGAATLVTGWPQHFDQVLAPLLNGGFAGVVHAHAPAHPRAGAPTRAVVDGGGAFTRPDLPTTARKAGTASAPQALPPIKVSAASKQAWAAAKAAWAAAPDTATTGKQRAEATAAGTRGTTAPVKAGESRSSAGSAAPRHDEATGRAQAGVEPAGRSATGAPVQRQRGESVSGTNATAQRPVQAGGETSAPPKVSTSAPAPRAGVEASAAGEHRTPGNPEHSGTGSRSAAAGETPVDARPSEGIGDGRQMPATGEHPLPGSEEHAAPAPEGNVLAGDIGDAPVAGSPSARDQAVELLADFHAGSGDRIPEQLRLCNLPDEVLQAGLFDADAHTSMIATTEILRRGTISDAVPGGMVLRVEQAEGMHALDKRPVEMKPGEGKSLMFMAAAMQRAVRHGECLLVTTTDGLAHREFTRYRRLLAESGIDVFLADQRNGFGPVTDGRPAIVVATGETVGHLCNAGHRPPRHALIDEMDGVIDRGERQFLRSEGVEEVASEATANEVFGAHDFLADALAKGALSHEDFGLARIVDEVDLHPDGTPEVEFWYDGQASLTPAGRAKVETMPGGDRWLDGMGSSRLDMAAVAEFSCRNRTHYVMDAGKIVIVDQSEHGLQRNPKTSSESRWSAETGKASLAQAVEAKEIRAAEAVGISAERHRIVVRADAENTRSITAVEIYRKGGRFFDEVTGASGTLADLNPVLEKIYGLADTHRVDRSQAQRLMEGAPDAVENTRAKLSTIADEAHRRWQGGRGRFQEILCHRNDLVDRQVQALVRRGVPREAIEAVDADRIAGWGADWEAKLQKVFDAAGDAGKILVINRQGQRGVDISVSEAVSAKGGMFVWMTEVPEQSYIYEQAKNRTARNGAPGSAQALMSPQDALIRKAMHLNGVREAAVNYDNAAAAHRSDPTPESHARLVEAGGNLGALVPELHQRALRHATADFIRHHAYTTADPAAVLAAVETGQYHGLTDVGQPDRSTDRAARLAGLLGIPAAAVAGTAAALEHDGAADPIRRLLEQTDLPPAAVEALRQQVETTAPATVARYARLTDEQALDQLIPQRDRLAGTLGLDVEDIDGAEGMRKVDPALTEARGDLAKALGYPDSSITPAIARDILGEAVDRQLPAEGRNLQLSAEGSDRPASPAEGPQDPVNAISTPPVADSMAAEDTAAVASRYLATAALLDLAVAIHRRSPNSCVNNAVTGLRVLTGRRVEMPSTALAGHGRGVVEDVFGARLENAGSLDDVAKSLKARPGGIAVLVYTWKDAGQQGSPAAEAKTGKDADNHMVLLVNDSEPGERPKLVVVDLAAARDGRTDTDYGPKDLRNRRALLNKAVSFEAWRHEQQKFLDKLPPDKRLFETIDFDRAGNPVARSHRDVLVDETRPRAVEVDADTVREIDSIPLGSPVAAEPARTGSRPRDTEDRRSDDLLDPTLRPLPEEVTEREIAQVTDILDPSATPEQLIDPDIRRGIRLAAEGLFIHRRVNGGHRRGATQVAENMRHIMADGLMQGADLAEIVTAMVAEAWSDLADGGGRSLGSSPRNATARSAELLHARALAHGCAPSTARILGFAVSGAGFDARTGAQLIASPAAVQELRQRWGNITGGELDTALRISRLVAATDLRAMSEPDAVVRWVRSDRDDVDDERRALIDRLRERADFADPDIGYRQPDGSLLGNRDMRRGNAVRAREIADRLAIDPSYSPRDAGRDARRHAAEMRKEHSGFRWQLVIGPGLDTSDPGALADAVAARLPESGPARERENIIDSVARLAALALPRAGGDAVFVVTSSQDADGRRRLLAELECTRPDATDPDPGVTADELRRELSDVDGRIDVDTADPLPNGQVRHRVRLDLTRQRILLLCTFFGRSGSGMSTLNLSLCRGLAEAGHEVLVRTGRVAQRSRIPGVQVYGPRDTVAAPGGRALYDGDNDDLPRSVDLVIVHAEDSGIRWASAAASRYPTAKLVSIQHLTPMLRETLGGNPGRGRGKVAANVYLARRAHLVTGLGPVLATDSLSAAVMAGHGSVHELQPGLEITDQPPEPAPGDPAWILLFGRIDDTLKGLTKAAEMVRRLRKQGRDVRLAVRGHPERNIESTRARLAALVGDPTAVELRPYTSSAVEVRDDIRAATVVVMPSRAEGFGGVATEAIEQGVPVAVPSSSGVGRFLADLADYRDLAQRFNLIEQPLGAQVPIDNWVTGLAAVLDNLPGAWSAARALQGSMRSFTNENRARMLVHAARNTDPHPAPAIPPSRTRVSLERGRVVARGEDEDYLRILAVVDAMESDPAVQEAVADGARIEFAPAQDPMATGTHGSIGSRPQEHGQPSDDTLGAWIRALRLERGMTQVRLAQEVGLTSSALSGFEKGKLKPRLGTFQQICRALGLEGATPTEAVRRFYPGIEVTTAVAAHDSLGGWLAALRNSKGLTRKDFAPTVGMSSERMAEIEHGARPRPGLFLRVVRVLDVGQQAQAEATHKFYPEITFDLDPAAHGRGTPGSWIAALRHDQDVSQAELARNAGISAQYGGRIEGGHTPTSIVFWRICRALGVAPDVLAVAARRFYPDVDLDTDPASHPPASPGSWIVALRHDRGMTPSEVAKAIGSGSDLSHIESGKHRLGFALFRRICDVLGVGDELLRAAAGHFYPDVDLDTDPASHRLMGGWIAALRHNRGMSAAELARQARMSERSLFAVEHGARLPRLRKLREIYRALGADDDVLLEAVGRFYADRYEQSGDRDEEELFDRYVVSRVGSPEEREIRQEICVRFAWVPNALARRVPPDIRDEAAQVAWLGILSAIDGHIPSTPFAAHAWASGSRAILRYRLARQFPDLDDRTLRRVVAVRAQIARMVSAGEDLDDTEIARAVGSTVSEVVSAREILARRTVQLDAPLSGRDKSWTRELPDPTASARFLDADFLTTVRAALTNMSDPGIAEQLVMLHLVDGMSLAAVAERLGLSGGYAAEVLADAVGLLRETFDNPGEEADPGGLIGSRPSAGEREFAGPGFEELVLAGLESGLVERTFIEDAPGVRVELVTCGNGLRVFEETYADPITADVQVLDTKVAAILGAPVAHAMRNREDGRVYRELTPDGRPGDDFDVVPPEVLASAQRLSLFDAVTRPNRSGQQWHVSHEDHAMAGRSAHDVDAASVSVFAAVLVQRVDGRDMWQDNALPRWAVEDVRRQVMYLELWIMSLPASDEHQDVLIDILHDRYLAALEQIERHAVPTPWETHHRAGLDDEAKAKARLVETFHLNYPHIAMAGFDHPNVPPHVVEEILGGVDEMLSRFPGRTDIRELRIDYDLDTRAGARSYWAVDPVTAAGRTPRILFGLDYAARPDLCVEFGVKARADGLDPIGDKPFHYFAVHEFVHAMDVPALEDGGRWLSADLSRLLDETWGQLSSFGLIEESRQTWLARLPRYAFDDAAKTELNAPEALAVGFAEADIHGVAIGTPQWMIHEYVTTKHPPRITPGLEVDLAGTSGGLIGSNPRAQDDSMSGDALGAWIKALRLERGMTRKQLTQAAGLANSALSPIESGQRKPRPGAFQRICRALGLEHEAVADAVRQFYSDVVLDTEVAAHELPGGWIRAVRSSTSMTQSELAHAVGVDPVRIGVYENSREQLRPGLFVRIARALGVGQQTLTEAVHRFYRDIEFDLDPAAHDPGLPGSWFAALRYDRNMSQTELERAAGISNTFASRIEGGYAPNSFVFLRICRALEVAPDVRADAARHFYQGLELDTDPTAHDPTSPGSWFLALRHDRDTPQNEVAKAIGISQGHLSNIEYGRSRPKIAVFRQICDALGVGDELQRTATGRFYSDIDIDIEPAAHDPWSPGSWIAALRNDVGMSGVELARRARMQPGFVSHIENQRFRPRLSKFRQLYDALGVGGDVLLEAVERFYGDRFEPSGDRDEKALFDRYVVSRVGSSEEREVRDEICARFAWVPHALARRVSPEIRDEAVQAAWMGILRAIDNHVPSTSFTGHAWASGGSAILRYRVAREFPDLDNRTLKKVGAVRAQLSRMASAGEPIDDTAIADATRLTTADVMLAREILTRPTLQLDAPITDNAGSRNRQLADPAAAAEISDTDFAMTVRAALADLPAPGAAERLVLLHLIDGMPLADAAERLGLQAADAAEMLTDAVARLRTAFDERRPSDSPTGKHGSAPRTPWTPARAEPDQPPAHSGDPEPGESGPGWLIGSRPFEDSPGERAFAGPGFEELVLAGLNSGIAERFPAAGAPGVKVEEVTFDNGLRVFRETYADPIDALVQVLQTEVAAIMGAPVAHAMLHLEDDRIYRELTPGQPGVGAEMVDREVLGSASATMLGLFDAVTRTHRTAQEWNVADNEVMGGRCRSDVDATPTGAFASSFVRRIDGREVWLDHALPTWDVAAIREPVSYLEGWISNFPMPQAHRDVLLDVHSRYVAALAQVERHAAHTSGEVTHRAGLDAAARAKARSAEAFTLKYPHIRMVGFDHPDVPAHIVQEILGGLDEMLTRFPDRTNIRELCLDYTDSAATSARTHYYSAPEAAGRTLRMQFSLRDATRHERAVDRGKRLLELGLNPVGDKPFHHDAVHEFVHALDAVAGLSRNLQQMLSQTHAQLSRVGLIDEHWWIWLARLPRYAFANEAKTILDAEEALAVGFTEADIHGAAVGTPQWAIHEYVTTTRPPQITADLEVDLPAQVDRPESGGSGGLIGSRPHAQADSPQRTVSTPWTTTKAEPDQPPPHEHGEARRPGPERTTPWSRPVIDDHTPTTDSANIRRT